MTGDELIAIARTWIGAPFLHNQASKSLGCDCAGLILGVAREAGLTRRDLPRYERHVPPATLLAYLKDELLPVWHEGAELSPIFRMSDADRASVGWSKVQPGDVLCLKIAAPRGEPMPRHLAYFTGAGLIHTEGRRGPDGKPTGVVETTIDDRSRRRLHSVWRWRGVETNNAATE